jgi:hypothetical protein
MNAPHPSVDDSERVFRAIDEMVETVNRFKRDPEFTLWVDERVACVPCFNSTDEVLLGRLITLIAYSNNAKADGITRLVDQGVLKRIFQDYSVEKVAELSPEKVIELHWHEIRAMRFKYKVDAMALCANCLLSIRKRYGSFMTYLANTGLPMALKSENDIRSFWVAFGKIQGYFRELNIPYFRNLTSLCHLLMDVGFDCAKPDLAVMKTAVDLGIVLPPPKQKKNPNKNRSHPEEDLRRTVETIQAYAISRNTRAPVMDLYFLIRGGQTGVTHLVKAGYRFLT